jgi:hypothetical protein
MIVYTSILSIGSLGMLHSFTYRQHKSNKATGTKRYKANYMHFLQQMLRIIFYQSRPNVAGGCSVNVNVYFPISLNTPPTAATISTSKVPFAKDSKVFTSAVRM